MKLKSLPVAYTFSFLIFIFFINSCTSGQTENAKTSTDSTAKTEGEKKGIIDLRKPIDTAEYNQLMDK